MRKQDLQRVILICGLGLISLFYCQKVSNACTLWAAAGNSVAKAGTIIAKNRDWEPVNSQELRLVRLDKGFRFIGLYDKNSRESGLKAGVNEYGLVAVNAAAPNINLCHRTNTIDLMERILSDCKTIHEVFNHRDWFHGSRFLLLADRKTLMAVEIGPNSLFTTKTTDSGTFCHTNHFIEPDFKKYNSYPINESSLARLSFIQNYLRTQKKFNFNDFIKISRSDRNGPDNSLWRRGKNPDSPRTMATFIVYQPIRGRAVLFVRFANLHAKIKEYHLDLNSLFQYSKSIPVSNFYEQKIL